MTTKEALAICEMILAHYWTREIPDERKAIWVGRLSGWDYEIAKDAVYASTDVFEKFPPSWAEFRQFLVMARTRHDQIEGLKRPALESGDRPLTDKENKAVLKQIQEHQRKIARIEAGDEVAAEKIRKAERDHGDTIRRTLEGDDTPDGSGAPGGSDEDPQSDSADSPSREDL